MNNETDPAAVRSAITPYFTVSDADLLVGFLKDVFDARLVRENRYDDNSIQHARLLIGDSLIMLNQSTAQYAANTSQMHICVDDADETWRKALQAGASSLMEPNDRPHGERMAGITDPCGNIWWIASPIR